MDQDLAEDQDTEAGAQVRSEISEEELSRNRAALRSLRPSHSQSPKIGQAQTRIQQDSNPQEVRVISTSFTTPPNLAASHDGFPMLSDHG